MDVNEARFTFGDQVAQSVQDGGFGGDIKPGGRLIHDEQFRIADQRHGDGDALLHAAAQFVRVALGDALGVNEADIAENAHHAFPRFGPVYIGCRSQRFGHLGADSDRRIERGAGVLRHELDALGPKLTHFVV